MRSSKAYTLVLILALLLGSSKTPKAASPGPTLSGTCHIQAGLPDRTCTPGAIDRQVTQRTIKKTICVSGYSQTVRPSTSYTNPLKLKIMQEYGFTDAPANYELDHLISLELGGNPTNEQNLWPESYTQIPGAREKDRVENYLHDQVCNGTITLEEAQKEISTDWINVYNRIILKHGSPEAH